MQSLQSLLYFLFWAGLIFFMVRFGCGAHAMRRGRRYRHDNSDAEGAGHSMVPATEAKEPVCRMTVPTPTGRTAVYQNRVYDFCSNACRGRFEDSPGAYAVAASASVPHKEILGGAVRSHLGRVGRKVFPLNYARYSS